MDAERNEQWLVGWLSDLVFGLCCKRERKFGWLHHLGFNQYCYLMMMHSHGCTLHLLVLTAYGSRLKFQFHQSCVPVVQLAGLVFSLFLEHIAHGAWMFY